MDTDTNADPTAPKTHDYRAISHTREGRVAEVFRLVADCDADAIAQIKALVRDLAVDLWDGLRFVEHVAGRRIATGGLVTAIGALCVL